MVQFQQIITGWRQMPDFLSPPVNANQLNLLIEFSNYLMDKIMEEEEDPQLEALLHLVGTYISEYEEINVPEPIGSPIEALEYLMEEHGLTRKDLSEKLHLRYRSIAPSNISLNIRIEKNHTL